MIPEKAHDPRKSLPKITFELTTKNPLKYRVQKFDQIQSLKELA